MYSSRRRDMWNEEAKTLSCPSWLIVSEECSPPLQYIPGE